MTIIETATEVWRFDCPRCDECWMVEYQRRRYTDASGARFEYYYQDGVPAVSPHAAALCRSCGYFFVHGRLVPASAQVVVPLPPTRQGLGGRAGLPR